jgi:hypothetical protein
MGPDEEALNEETLREEPMIEAAMIECDAAAVVVEGPGCDAKFLSEWVAAADKVQAAWDAAGEGPDGELYNGVLYGELIHFGLWAIDFISRLRRSRRAVAAVLPFAESARRRTTLRSWWGWGSLKPLRITTAWWSRTISSRPRSKLPRCIIWAPP